MKTILTRFITAAFLITATVLFPAVGFAENRTNRLAASVPSTVVVGSNMILRIDGRPFFPIGVYHAQIDQLPKVAAAGFNTVQGWGADLPAARTFLEAAAKSHLKVLLELSAFLRGDFNIPAMLNVVAALKDQPALLAWYMIDEPLTQRQLAAGRMAYAEIHSIDPYHPVFVVENLPRLYFSSSAIADVFGIDPYPVPYHPVRQVTDWFRDAEAVVGGEKPVWLVVQAHDQTGYPGQKEIRGPTTTEERNMVYQGIAAGAKGILFYTWNDGTVGLVHDPPMLREVSRLCSELADSASVLEGTRTIIRTSNPDVEAVVFSSPSERLLILLNISAATQGAVFTSPFRLSAFLGNTRLRSLGSGRLLVDLKPLQVVRIRVDLSNGR